MTTKYDWVQRGHALAPEGNKNPRSIVIVARDGGIFLEMYVKGYLMGQALADAIERYGPRKR